MTKVLQDLNLGQNLQRIRKSKEMTQMDVCAKLDLMGRPMLQSNYAQIEGGTRNIFVSDLIALKRIFGVDYSEFFVELEPIRKYSDIE